MRFYNNRYKVPPVIPLNPVAQNAIFDLYIPPLCSTFITIWNQSVAFKQNKSVCWGRGETPPSLPMRREFSQSLYFLTLHLGTILANNRLDALFQCIYLFHSSTCFEQPSAHHQENRIVSIHHLVCFTLCR